MRRWGVALLTTMVFGAPLLRAEVGSFVPTAVENGAYFDLFSSHEREDISGVARPYGWSDTFFREKLTLFSDGYIYHPRFLQYHLSLAGALKQEQYEATQLASPGWQQDSGLEYDARMLLLAEHPYNFELFAFRYEPLYKEQAATQHGSVESSRGFSFQYRERPWLLHSKYSLDAIDTGVSSTETRRLGLDGRYVRQYVNGTELSFAGVFNPSRTSNSRGLESETQQALLGSLLDTGRARLNSNLAQTTYEQDDPASGRYSSEQFAWYEILNLDLPHRLRANLTYRLTDNDSAFPDPSAPGTRRLSDQSRDYQLDIIHRLYESLDTTYTYLNAARTSPGGENDSTLHALNLNYSKAIPRGRVAAGTALGRNRTENQGAIDVANEPHLGVSAPGSAFLLNQPDVAAGSVVVYVRSPIAPFDNIQLAEGVHYTLTTIGNTVEVFILALPLSLPAGVYDFFVSYALAAGDYELGVDTLGFTTSVDLLDMLLTPYASYVEVRSDLISGVFPGTPLDSTTVTAGLRFLQGPLRARVEYQDLRWEVSPYTAWRGEAQYVGSPSPGTSVYGTVAYLNRDFPQGASTGPRAAYYEETTSLSGNIRKDIPARQLTLGAGGSMSRTVGLVETLNYSLNATVTWKIGLMDLTGGASVYGSSAEGIPNAASDRTHQYYYLQLRRHFLPSRRGAGSP